MKEQPGNGCKVEELPFQGRDVVMPSLLLHMFAVA